MPLDVSTLQQRRSHGGRTQWLAPVWIAILIFAGGPASSQDAVDEWYVKLFGGATFPQANEFRIDRIFR